jgi:hypothetical protein
MKSLSFLFAWLLPSLLLSAQQPPATVIDETAGRDLAAKLRALTPAARTESTGLLKIRDREGRTRTVPVHCLVVPGATDWRVIYETAPTPDQGGEKLVIIHHTNAPNEYLHARAEKPGGTLGEPQPVSRERLSAPLAGSDFSLLDLGLDFFHWPTQRLYKPLRPEMRMTRPCDLLESIRPNPPAGSYARVKSWLDKETGGPIAAEAFGADGKLMKEFSIKGLTKVEGRWELEEMEIRDVIKKSRTRLEFEFPEAVAK